MKNVYQVYLRNSDGTISHSAGKFASRENAKKAIKKYYRIAEHGERKILAWKIVNTQTGETVEQSGRM